MYYIPEQLGPLLYLPLFMLANQVLTSFITKRFGSYSAAFISGIIAYLPKCFK